MLPIAWELVPMEMPYSCENPHQTCTRFGSIPDDETEDERAERLEDERERDELIDIGHEAMAEAAYYRILDPQD
jgi:hypothetical protein